jgi:Ran GTPase-activating protein (RanGAP) involved in mRNA processing and transport
MPHIGESIYLSGEQWWNEDTVLERLNDVRSGDKTFLYLQKLILSERIASAMIQLIEEDFERVWSKLLVSECQENPHFQRMIETALARFSWIILSDLKSTCVNFFQTVAKGMQGSSRLQKLELREMKMTPDEVACFSRGLAKSTSLQVLRFGTVRLDTAGLSKLAQGLRTNQSLETVQLVRCQLKDEEVALVAEALMHHPCIEKLDLSGNHCRQVGLRSLSELLSQDDCTLRVLKLNDQFFKMVYDESSLLHVDELVDGLQQNESLRQLELSRNELCDVDSLLAILWKCPNLKVLDLMGNRITRLKSWRRFWLQTRPSRLQKLDLSFNPFHYGRASREENAELLCLLLESHPELEYVGNMYNVFWKNTCHQVKIQHYLDLNKGRTLIANNNMPLSVWPYVFERANRLFHDSRQANVIFHLLHGPVTVPRRS